MKKALVLVVALAGCQTAQLDLDSRWPTDLPSASDEALRISRPIASSAIGRGTPATCLSENWRKVRADGTKRHIRSGTRRGG